MGQTATETAALFAPTPRRPQGLLGYAWRRLRGNLPALLSALALLVILLAAALAPFLAAYNPNDVGVGPPLAPPSRAHLLGTDRHGRDVLSRILFGARLSLPVGLAAVAFSMLFGTMFGLVTGFYGGRIDGVGSKVIDIWLGFPAIMIALIIITILGIGIQNVVIAVGISGIPRFARMVRGQTLSIKENEGRKKPVAREVFRAG